MRRQVLASYVGAKYRQLVTGTACVLTLGIRLNNRGYVRSVSAKHSGNLPDELSECAAQRVAMVMFPPADDDKPRSVVVPIMFRGIAQ